MITLSIDPSVDAAYIALTDEPVAETIELTPSVQVDLDASGTVVGIELLTIPAELPLLALDQLKFPASLNAFAVSQIWSSFSYRTEGQGRAHSFPALQTA